jgi:probable O-glycosylation ligase (exosortase A-associated)
MRDVAFLSLLAMLLPVAVIHPWIGTLLWTWISVMNPHAYMWVANSLPIALVVAVATFLGLIFSRDPKCSPLNTITLALITFIGWMCVTTALAFRPDVSGEMLGRVLKIQLMVLVTIMVLTNRKQIDALVWVLVLSLGFYGVKGGLFTIATGGSYRIWGPPNSFIEDNNALGLALVMVIPLMHYLQLVTMRKWIRHGLTVAMLLTAAAAIGTQSRGAFLAIASMALLLWWRSRQKLAMGTVVLGSAVALFIFMPQSWHQRMDTIQSYESDASAMGRIYTWEAMFNIAKDRITGGGFDVYKEADVLPTYKDSRDTKLTRAAHSIYFEVLGEHGFIGLGLFLICWVLVWRSAGRVYRRARGEPQTEWASQLANMCQVSLVGYLVGGAFLSLAYFDLPYDIMILVVLAQRSVKDASSSQRAPARFPLAVMR